MNIEDALTAYREVLVAAGHRWRVKRDRRRRRFVVTSGIVVLAAVIAGTAIAATGWLVGSPAPPRVKSDFGSYATQLGFNPEPGKAVLAASDGAYKLYVTSNKQGGYCTLVSDPWYHPGPHGEGGDCAPRKALSIPFWAGMGGIASLHHGRTRLVIIGRTRHPDASRLRFNYPVGKTATATVGKGGFFIVPVTISHPIFTGFQPGAICRWSSSFAVENSNGQTVARKTIHFGPQVCVHPPNPLVKTKAGTATFFISRGADGYLEQARPGDNVVCQGSGHRVSMTIPQAQVHGHVRKNIKPVPLQINIAHTRTGRIWVMCS